MQILNSDGSAAAACGNGTRCVADHIMRELGRDRLAIETNAGILQSWRAFKNPSHIAVDMGSVYLDWEAVPLASKANTLSVDLGPLAPVPAVCHSVGNPHAVIFVDDAEVIDLDNVGPPLEHHPLFPERANISFAHQIGPNKFRMGFGNVESALPLPVAAELVQLGLRFTGLDVDRETLKLLWMADRFY